MHSLYDFIGLSVKKRGVFALLVLLLAACTPEAQEAAAISLEQTPRQKQNRGLSSALLNSPPAFSAELLERCLFVEPCLIEELPPLGLDHEELEETAPIMERVWSSSPWMKDRFHQLLQALPPSYLQLFRPVTAIAIAEDIRPSHYWPTTGGIYIDPAFLWFTQAEKNTIHGVEDGRTKNLDDFSFRVRWRYVDGNNTNPFRHHSLQWEENRTLERIFDPFAIMMTHELAHANDYLPPYSYELLYDDITFYDAVFYGIDTYLPHLRISTTLQERFPINAELVPTARSYYSRINGSTAHNLTATEISHSFAADVTSSFYSYTHRQEDLAMLFEEVMMKEFFDLDRDMAFTETSQEGNLSCNDYIVRWGIRNRFAHPTVRARAEFSVNQIFPDYDFTALFEEVDGSTPLAVGLGWCDSMRTNDYSFTAAEHSHSTPSPAQPDYDLFEYHSININAPFIPQP